MSDMTQPCEHVAHLDRTTMRRVDSLDALHALDTAGVGPGDLATTVHPADVQAMLHTTREQAQVAITCNRDHFDHPVSWGPIQVGDEWLEVLDLRPALATFDRGPTPLDRPWDHIPTIPRLPGA